MMVELKGNTIHLTPVSPFQEEVLKNSNLLEAVCRTFRVDGRGVIYRCRIFIKVFMEEYIRRKEAGKSTNNIEVRLVGDTWKAV